MIYVGIDDTDTLDTPGTNQLARALAARVAAEFDCRLIVRHQLLNDPRVPYTSKNGSASMVLSPRGSAPMANLIEPLRQGMREWYIPGSDPGFCVTEHVPPEIRAFGQRCQSELIHQEDARRLAAEHHIHLEGIGGTEGGVIGALAAVGLIADQNDGRVVHIGSWPDDLSGPQSLDVLAKRGVLVRRLQGGARIPSGVVDVGKHLRPNLRAGEIVLFVEPFSLSATPHCAWQAVRLL